MLSAPSLKPAGRVFYGWWIVLSGAVLMGMESGLFSLGFGFFFEPMRRHFGWSRTLLSGAYSLTRVESGIIAPFLGYIIQRFGPRIVIAGSFILFGVGYILLSLVNSPLTFYLAFLVLALGGGSGGFAGVMASINNWFRRKRARAIGFAMLGMGLGGVVYPPLLALGIDNFDWRNTAVALGLFVVAVGVPLSLVVRFNPEPYGYTPDGGRLGPGRPVPGSRNPGDNPIQPRPEELSEPDYTVWEALRTRAFWLMSTGHALALLVISTISLHQVPYLENDLGFSKVSAAQVVMVMTGVNMCGQVIGGFLADRFPKHYIVAGTLLGHSLGLLLLASADSYGQVMFSAVVQGLAWGIRSPSLISMRGDYFGRRAFPMIMGLSHVVMTVGMVLGPLIAGYLADQSSYSVGFEVVAVCTLPGTLVFFLLKKPEPGPSRAPAQ